LKEERGIQAKYSDSVTMLLLEIFGSQQSNCT
jgi:hypothetical protein